MVGAIPPAYFLPPFQKNGFGQKKNELEATSQLQLRTAPFSSPEQLLAEAADDEDH